MGSSQLYTLTSIAAFTRQDREKKRYISLIMRVSAFSNYIFSLLCSWKVQGTYRVRDYESKLHLLASLMSADTYRGSVPLANYLVSSHSSCLCHETKKQQCNKYRVRWLARKIHHSWVV